MRAFGAEWRTANIEGKVLSKPTKSKWRAGWIIGDQNLEFDHIDEHSGNQLQVKCLHL